MAKRAVSFQTKGVKELTAQLRNMMDVVASKEVAIMLGDAGRKFIAHADTNMRTENWPHETQGACFVDARWPQSKRKKAYITILFGIRKRGKRKPFYPWYAEWAGGTRGMSLTTMYELGTSKTQARPAWRPAIVAGKPEARATVKERLPEIVLAARGRNYNG